MNAKQYKQGFYGNLIISHTIGEKESKLVEELIYIDKKGRTHRAPANMPTDGLSIPRFFWRVVDPPMSSKYLAAAIIHDHYCYKAAHLADSDIKAARKLRKDADKLFYEMLRYLGCGFVKAKAMYRAVRLGSITIKT